MKKILVADVPQMDARYAAAFAGCEIAFVRSLGEAHQALEGRPCDLVAIGVYFDDSQVFDLLRYIRADDEHGEVPVVCVRGQPGFTAVSGRMLEGTVKALAGDAFVDLVHFADEAGGNAALRAAASQFLT
jgi:PleD family two-component response regulator